MHGAAPRPAEIDAEVFSAAELAELAFAGPPPDAASLSRQWHHALKAARAVIALLPPEEAGTCVLAGEDLCRFAPGDLESALAAGAVRYRTGSLRGILPRMRPEKP